MRSIEVENNSELFQNIIFIFKNGLEQSAKSVIDGVGAIRWCSGLEEMSPTEV